MNGLIRASLKNPRAVTVMMLAVLFVGYFSFRSIPIDILPVFNSPAVQVLTFYAGMPAEGTEKDITNRMERWTGQSAGMSRQESRSIVGASIVRNYYRQGVDPNGALTQVNSLASGAIPNLPPGTLPPVILPFDPTSTTPACMVALDSEGKYDQAITYDVGRYEVRNFIMASPGANAPVVYGGKIRAVLAYLDREKLQARHLSPVDVMNALDEFNVFLPTGDAKLGTIDYAIDSNSMYRLVQKMGDIPLRVHPGADATFLRDVAKPEDAAFIQTNIVRVNGRRQVYIPVYRELGSSTLSVVNDLKKSVPDMEHRVSRPGIKMNVVMDQSVYVRQSIYSLAQEGILGAILCSLVIFLFLGEWRMTAIAVLMIPIAITASVIGLKVTGNTINVMTLAGMALAIGPMVDSAIICLENTHRHLSLGDNPHDSAFLGASEVAMPELVASLCTLLVLSPLALMPGIGEFLFQPMAFAVAFAMIAAYLLSRTFVPTRCAAWLRSKPEVSSEGHAEQNNGDSPAPAGGVLAQWFSRWQKTLDSGIGLYADALAWVMQHRVRTIVIAVGSLVAVVAALGLELRRDFFPEVDAGAFQMTVRAASGTRIEVTEQRIAQVEQLIRKKLGKKNVQTIISNIGVTPDWSAAYTLNSGPMDTEINVQLTENRSGSAQEYVQLLRTAFAADERFTGLEFSFDAGGMIADAMNEGKPTPINIRIESNSPEKAHKVALNIQKKVERVPGVVDCRILQRLDYPEYIIDVDRQKAADLGLAQADVMKNVVAALNSSVQFNKTNFWIDPVSHNQYYVGVQYPEADIKTVASLLDVPITSPVQKMTVPLRNIASLRRAVVPAEVTHINLSPTIDLALGVHGRDLGHVGDDVNAIVAQFGEVRPGESGVWTPYDPDANEKQPMEGSKLSISGEYSRMKEMFSGLGLGLLSAAVLIYFLMVALFRSYLTPLVIMSAVPIGVTGVVLVLFITGTALDVQSLLGVIFMVGIVVSNTVLLTDFAQNIRDTEHLNPTDAMKKAASIRVRPIVMTALATFFALIPMSLALERGSEANAPLGRAVIGGLLAGLVTTLFVVPALYSLVIRDVPVTNGSVGNEPETAPQTN
jgi:multidrug efflux pump subunit AcrB